MRRTERRRSKFIQETNVIKNLTCKDFHQAIGSV
uniref:Uncharacterized protein n=1 Tax=Anguilla anguilla TaxID=7936 RepID=A0A0E9SKZ1_ANGAN